MWQLIQTPRIRHVAVILGAIAVLALAPGWRPVDARPDTTNTDLALWDTTSEGPFASGD